MTSVQRKGHFAQKSRAFQAPSSPSSHKSDRSDYENPLGSNKPKPSKTPTLETPTPLSETLKFDITWYTQKDLDQIIKLVF